MEAPSTAGVESHAIEEASNPGGSEDGEGDESERATTSLTALQPSASPHDDVSEGQQTAGTGCVPSREASMHAPGKAAEPIQVRGRNSFKSQGVLHVDGVGS